MTILTAYTDGQRELVEIQRKAALKCGIAPERIIAVPIPHSYPKPPSWFRVRALLDHLPNHERILWLDTDAMLLKNPSSLLEEKGEHTLYVAQDHNGINNGVACWSNTPKAREALWRIYDSYDRFAQHPWFEQGALQTQAEEIDIGWMQKHIFNANEKEVTADTVVLHLPNRPHDVRVTIMQQYLRKL